MAARRAGRARPPAADPKAAIQDWLTLVEPDGAFLTPSELSAAFPSGFEPMPAEHRTGLRARVADVGTEAADRLALRHWLLETVLDWEDQLADGQRIPVSAVARAAEHGVELRPTHVLLDVDDPNRVRLGVFAWPLGTRLDRRPDPTVAGDTWPASPVQRAETWCRESGVPLALVTDDDQWVLVWAPRGAPAAAGRWSVADLADERILQSGFVSLLGARRFFAVDDDDTIERLFQRAADAEADLTKGLGRSVRRSVELLVAAISRDDVATDGRVLDGVPATEVYEASVAVLMRLVFLLFAEERRLLPAEDPLWAESYSVLTLRDDLRRASTRDGEDALERRSTAWHRMLATFRAVHGGANHDRLTLPAYGGSLFDPDRFPFLEGRRAPDHVVAGGVDLGPAEDAAVGPGRPVKVDDRTVLAILDALLTIEVKVGRTKVAQRVSYKALDVEQIGHCYEGLLDHGCAPVEELSLGLVGPDGGEPEISISDLEARLAEGTGVLCEWLSDKSRCGRTVTALAKDLQRQPSGVEVARLRAACGHDDDTVGRVLPFWGLIRNDLRRLPIVLLPGSKYVTQTSMRRNMGAQYTTKALAEEVVQYALEPLVYEPGPQNEADREKWRLRTPGEILDLRVCDPAVGSGAILTAAGRYLAERLVEAVTEHGSGTGRFADRLADLAAASPDEQTVLARREVVDHCLYGVDKNPVAAEMAKLSLWLTTMARERPFTFLDHAIQVGDSLLGITDLDQLRWLHLDPEERRGVRGFESLSLDMRTKEAADLARRLQELSVVTVRDAAQKQRLHDELRTKLADLSVVADAVVGAALNTAGKRRSSPEDRLASQLERIRAALDDDQPEIERAAAIELLRSVSNAWLRTDLPDDLPMPWDRQCLHWPLAFPEVFLETGRSGFDAMVANPPFLGGTRITEASGASYRAYLGSAIAGRQTDRADLVAFFLLRMATLGRCFGSLATNTVAEGDTREIGLVSLLEKGWTIAVASKSSPWPGDATLEISKLWLHFHEWLAPALLQGRPVARINSLLEPERRISGRAQRLVRNSGLAFLGDQLNSKGFLLTSEEAQELIGSDEQNSQVVMPFIGGNDLNATPAQSASRWVINFRDWPFERAASYPQVLDTLRERTQSEIASKSPRNYKGWASRWWQFWMYKSALHAAIEARSHVVALVLHSPYAMPALVSAHQVFSHGVGVFAFDDYGRFGVLSSTLHNAWAIRYGSSLETRIRYTPSDVFETFPQPEPQTGLRWDYIDDAGRRLHELRAELMVCRNLGLTKTYNRVHDPDEHDPDIVRLRELHVELDHAVRDAYGWSDLPLDHHHWETPQGMRFTVSPEAKDELLDRLLELNHERYAAEVAAGLHDKKAQKNAKAARKRAGKASPNQRSLL